ncbi:hypothetical protein TRFO_03655 [Tritrichomonas foetus]|uniref:Peptidase S59 domain-containing protein n=1 Tax=Tritrichomonas foetus TaxID=1144522 RepID=A0A1J4KN10_9EUKA|nr:hypothetical protein TRFO_03655 [Tritrichomonas foetus]|eukprot:OHT12619.1 hypothetical protein TRFO_03655 [Tritrichomonas foetus]
MSWNNNTTWNNQNNQGGNQWNTTGFGNSGGFGFGSTGTAQSQVSGGYSKTKNATFGAQQQVGGWGQTAQVSSFGGTGAFGTGGLGGGAFGTGGYNYGANAGQRTGTVGFGNKTGFGTGQKTGFGTSGFGTSGFGTGGFGTGGFGTGGFGTGGFGYNQPPPKPPVPISTLGFPFTSTEKQDHQPNGAKKTYKVYHINILEMFSQYTTEELRYFDYLSNGAIPNPQQPQMPIMGQQQGTGMNTTGTTFQYGQQKQSSVQPVKVDWSEVPKEIWGQIPALPEAKQQQPYGALSPTQLDVSSSLSSENPAANELKVFESVKLKGFKKNETLFSKVKKAGDSFDISLTPGITRLTPLEIQYENARGSISPGINSLRSPTSSKSPRSPSSSASTSRRSSSINSMSSSKTDFNPSQFNFIPDILYPKEKIMSENMKYCLTKVTNLKITKDNASITFPQEIDIKDLDPANSVKIENIDHQKLMFDFYLHSESNIAQDLNVPTIVTLTIEQSQVNVNFKFCPKDGKEIQVIKSVDSAVAFAYVPSLDYYPITVEWGNE